MNWLHQVIILTQASRVEYGGIVESALELLRARLKASQV